MKSLFSNRERGNSLFSAILVTRDLYDFVSSLEGLHHHLELNSVLVLSKLQFSQDGQPCGTKPVLRVRKGAAVSSVEEHC